MSRIRGQWNCFGSGKRKTCIEIGDFLVLKYVLGQSSDLGNFAGTQGFPHCPVSSLNMEVICQVSFGGLNSNNSTPPRLINSNLKDDTIYPP